MCRAFLDTWKRQQFIEPQAAKIKDFENRVEAVKRKIEGFRP